MTLRDETISAKDVLVLVLPQTQYCVGPAVAESAILRHSPAVPFSGQAY
jgi:hypothetical protein